MKTLTEQLTDLKLAAMSNYVGKSNDQQAIIAARIETLNEVIQLVKNQDGLTLVETIEAITDKTGVVNFNEPFASDAIKRAYDLKREAEDNVLKQTNDNQQDQKR